MNSKDMLARLLASENLNVIRARTTTASFDIKSRTLILPMWKEMTEDVEDMLISHEVGHALFTTEEYGQVENFRKLHGYLNVIEDVRIEKMMKNKYPGLRKCFISGYKQLNDKDFFSIKDKDLSKLLLIDRINIYYKCGINSGVKFNPVEMEFVRRVDRCDTIKDVHALAEEIYAYSYSEIKKKKEELKAKQQETMTAEDMEDIETLLETEYDNDAFYDDDDMEEEDRDLMEGEYDPYAEEEEASEGDTDPDRNFVAGGNEPSKVSDMPEDEELESKTERALRMRLQDLADVNTIVRHWVPVGMPRAHIGEQFVSFQEILSEFDREFNRVFDRRKEQGWDSDATDKEKASTLDFMRTDAKTFKTETSKIVNYLVKEFEMRKSATAYRRNKISKTGNLNVNKLAVYQLTDDIFKRITVTKDTKNHGMVFLIDWSGSMGDCITDTLKQAITLAMFCQRAQIPFKVMGFSNGWDRFNRDDDGRICDERQYGMPARNPDGSYVAPHSEDFKGFYGTDVYLLELLNHKMTNSEFTKMCQILLLPHFWIYAPRLSLNSTPLNESLLYMIDYLGSFKQQNNIEKLTFITLTDGEGGSLNGNHFNNLREYETVYEPEYKRCKVIHYLTDPITKKEYKINQESSVQTNTLLKIIKDRYNASIIGFYIGRNSKRDLLWFVRNNVTSSDGGMIEDMIAVENMQKEMRKNDFALLTNCGRDELYVIPSHKLAIQEEDLSVSSEMNSKQIAKAFNKYLNVQKTNRVLLNRFVNLIA